MGEWGPSSRKRVVITKYVYHGDIPIQLELKSLYLPYNCFLIYDTFYCLFQEKRILDLEQQLINRDKEMLIRRGVAEG